MGGKAHRFDAVPLQSPADTAEGFADKWKKVTEMGFSWARISTYNMTSGP
jgi:hypothetical protein